MTTDKGEIRMKRLAIPLIAVMLIAATPAQAEPRHKVCTGILTLTYTAGTAFAHHQTYDTVSPFGPLPTLVITKCIQYKEVTE